MKLKWGSHPKYAIEIAVNWTKVKSVVSAMAQLLTDAPRDMINYEISRFENCIEAMFEDALQIKNNDEEKKLELFEEYKKETLKRTAAIRNEIHKTTMHTTFKNCTFSFISDIVDDICNNKEEHMERLFKEWKKNV